MNYQKPFRGQIVQQETPGRKNLVALYVVNEYDGSLIFDHAKNNNSLTVNSGAVRLGQYIDISGVVDIVKTDATQLPTTHGTVILKMSLAAWGSDGGIFELSDNSTSDRILFYSSSGDNLYLFINGVGGSPVNVWFLVELCIYLQN